MCIIQEYIKNNNKFILNILINAHTRLSYIQLQKGYVTQEDIHNSLQSDEALLSSSLSQSLPKTTATSTSMISSSDIILNVNDSNAHAALLVESTLIPLFTPSGQIQLQMIRDIINNINNFILSIINIIYMKCENTHYPLMDEFCTEANAFLQSTIGISSSSSMSPQPLTLHSQLLIQQHHHHNSNRYHTIKQHHNNHNNHHNYQQLRYHDKEKRDHHHHQQQQNNSSDDNSKPNYRIEFEKSEPIIRLLAQVRKVGMDILFPQQVHDKVCLFN
jgi:hypothetical protein